jgi:hypothetical protein
MQISRPIKGEIMFSRMIVSSLRFHFLVSARAVKLPLKPAARRTTWHSIRSSRTDTLFVAPKVRFERKTRLHRRMKGHASLSKTSGCRVAETLRHDSAAASPVINQPVHGRAAHDGLLGDQVLTHVSAMGKPRFLGEITCNPDLQFVIHSERSKLLTDHVARAPQAHKARPVSPAALALKQVLIHPP